YTTRTFGFLDARVALERSRLLADALLAIELGDAHRLLALLLFDQRLALERGACLAELLLFLQLGDADELLALGFTNADLAQLDRVRYLHGTLALRFGNANFAQLLLLGHVAARLLNGGGSCLLTDRLDVPRLVLQVGDVHVDEDESDLAQLGLE